MRLGVLATLLALAATPAHVAAADLAELDRLSIDLRGRRLDAVDVRDAEAALAAGTTPDALYQQRLTTWLTRASLPRVLGGFLGGYADTDARVLFVGPLARRKVGKADWLYYLPHRHPKKGVPCPAAARERVRAWWSPSTPITICSASRRPMFDDVGFCGGQAEPRVPQPPRPGCGCGPALLACLPPEDERPGLADALTTAMADEARETVLDVVDSNHRFDEVFTTSRTWQSGLAAFMYLRRELIGLARTRPDDAALEEDLVGRLAPIDLAAPPAWIERHGLYASSGVLALPALASYLATYRVVAHSLLERALCVELTSVNVDARTLLAAVGPAHANLRAFGIGLADSPMRKQAGCKGCHAPLDGVAAMLQEIATPLLGGYPTGADARGGLWVTGAADRRGEGTGLAALARLVVAQPEHGRCAVKTAWTSVLHRPPLASERAQLDALTTQFERGGRRLRPLIEAILRSPAYRHPNTPPPAAARLTTPPARLATLMRRHCSACHDGDVQQPDLTTPPPVHDVTRWSRILEMLETSRMPPPREGEIAAHYPLDPQDRRAMILDVEALLGAALAERPRPRHLPADAWASVARAVAAHVPAAELDPILDGVDALFASDDAIWPAELLELEDKSRAICEAASSTAQPKPTDPDTWVRTCARTLTSPDLLYLHQLPERAP